MSERSSTPRRAVRGWEHGRWVTIPEEAGALRALVLAESGAGKTTLFSSTMLAALSRGWQVVMIDAKGQQGDITQLLSDVQGAGYPARQVRGVRIFGEEDEAHSILTAPWPDSGGDGDHYRRRDRRMLAAALRGHPATLAELLAVLRDPPAGAPADVRAALSAEATRGVTTGQATAEAVEDSWGSLGPLLSGSDLLNFADLDPGLTVLTVRPKVERERLLGIAAMLAYGQHLTRVQARDDGVEPTPLLVVIDEFAQLVQKGSDPASEAATLFETARSANMSLMLAAQSIPGISTEEGMQRRLLESGAAILAGRTKVPGPIVELAGTVRRLEAAEAVEDRQITSGRSQDTFTIPADRLREARAGMWWLIQEGAVAEFACLRPSPAEKRHVEADRAEAGSERGTSAADDEGGGQSV